MSWSVVVLKIDKFLDHNPPSVIMCSCILNRDNDRPGQGQTDHS